ncbi:hypothetical protein GT037_000624 [Alternaria burnsii]|uniref:AMMECR1 domain-containing protein n=1 Tax=Alternaria burnsii TaxID=1187904 RepID=A0A8H7BHH0_9PLEO|nr:uncharacterized protein GT037_000624 [Alternaria burnsii]KAF7681648.1 hypothetical protein GT037_000624 [Alternaria burnsii]
MATQAHCAYCFESLVASLEKRPSLTLAQVEHLWAKYNSEPTTTSELEDETEAEQAEQAEQAALASASASVSASADGSYKPAAISRILASPPSSASSSSLQSASSTPSGPSSETPSSLTSQSSSSTNLTDKEAEEEEEEEHPLFVTWNTISRSGDKRLRGCIGTFEAQPLTKGLSDYALTAAFDDTRFSPITTRELPTLECAVTLLTDFEPVDDAMDWEIGKHGLRISFHEKGRRYGSTYLPDVASEQGWTKEEALVSLMRKAGWNGKKADWNKVSLRIVRYQGKKVGLGWGEWRSWRDWVDEEMADV